MMSHLRQVEDAQGSSSARSKGQVARRVPHRSAQPGVIVEFPGSPTNSLRRRRAHELIVAATSRGLTPQSAGGWLASYAVSPPSGLVSVTAHICGQPNAGTAQLQGDILLRHVGGDEVLGAWPAIRNDSTALGNQRLSPPRPKRDTLRLVLDSSPSHRRRMSSRRQAAIRAADVRRCPACAYRRSALTSLGFGCLKKCSDVLYTGDKNRVTAVLWWSWVLAVARGGEERGHQKSVGT
jgi:hypothetical protein